MLNKQLNVGDHIMDANGNIFVIVRVNKATYHIEPLCNNPFAYEYEDTLPFKGKVKTWTGRVYEYFHCDDVQKQIIDNLLKKNAELEKELDLREGKDYLNKVKGFAKDLKWLMVRYGLIAQSEAEVDK